MSLATTRERRKNAGSKIAKLLNEEEQEDEFYKTAYGGFSEVCNLENGYETKIRAIK
jgi:vacuolar protein sorting-associated protein 72